MQHDAGPPTDVASPGGRTAQHPDVRLGHVVDRSTRCVTVVDPAGTDQQSVTNS